MDDTTKRTKRVAFQPTRIKPNYSIKPRPDKRKARLDASQNALRVVEQAIGAKLVENKRRDGR
jgi:ribosomal protein L28